MKLKTNFSTLLFIIFASKSAQDVTTGRSRQGNDITVTCESFPKQGDIRIQVVSVSADGSNSTAPLVNLSTSMTAFTAMATFNVTPSDEKAAYCEVGRDLATPLVYFGGKQMIIQYTIMYNIYKSYIL